MFIKRILQFAGTSVVTVTAVLFSIHSGPASAQRPVCSSPSFDSDGDGFGWENNQTCLVTSASTTGNNTNSSGNSGSGGSSLPVCSSASSDPDNDGFGFENNRSCRVTSSSSSSNSSTASSSGSSSSGSSLPVCASAASDPDNDGFGFENNRSCRVTSASGSQSSSPSVSAAVSGISSRFPACRSRASDPDNDGFGFEDGRTCVVTSSSSNASSTTSSSSQAGSNSGSSSGSSSSASSRPAGAAPPPVSGPSAGFSNGRPVCLTDDSDVSNSGFGFENGQTCVVTGATGTRINPFLNQRTCIPWLEVGYGNYKLSNNVWNASAVFSNNWSQCIEVTGSPGNYVAKWDYNWLGRNEGNEFAVKSYPQVYFGRKTRYNISGSVAETGLPQETNRLSQFQVQYDYSETGNAERNVALESFFHTSCEAEEENKQFEMMVWVGVPDIRTPGTQVTTARIDGQDWDVYVNNSLPWGYVAFWAQNPSNRGTLDWNAFVDWSRFVGPSFGVPRVGNNTCMGAIEIGTETFWGTGTFTLNRFQVNRR